MGLALCNLGIRGCHIEIILGWWLVLEPVALVGTPGWLRVHFPPFLDELRFELTLPFYPVSTLWAGRSKCNAHISSRLQWSWKDDLLVSRFNLLTSCQGLRDGVNCLVHEFLQVKKKWKYKTKRFLVFSIQKTLLLKSTLSLFSNIFYIYIFYFLVD